uniref:Coiled-coil domain containing 50b n=1 Tax=Latimeria chalumnae TaxID=7897 RepID=H3ALW9_LATCH
MTDIDIDQSHLPRVREVCEGFAVLEDGALAHFLQEQEIENYYASNIEKNQLVQKDIRIAKKLQGEENEYCRQLTEHQQRLVEERDLEYARAIQEELQLQAAEHRRREEEDGCLLKSVWCVLPKLLMQEKISTVKSHWRRGLLQIYQYPTTTSAAPKQDIKLFYSISKCICNRSSSRRVQWNAQEIAKQLQEEEERQTEKPSLRSLHHGDEEDSNRVPVFRIAIFSKLKQRDSGSAENYKRLACDQSGKTPWQLPPTSVVLRPATCGCSENVHSRRRERRRSRRAERREKLSRWHDERCGPSSSEDEEPRELEARGRVKRHSSHGQPQECRRPRSVTNQSASSSGKRSPTTGLPAQKNPPEKNCIDEEFLKPERNLQLCVFSPVFQRSQSRQKQEEDYRAAQVAQDEEIAKYMQRQEIKAQQRAKEREMCRNSPQEDAEDDSHSMERERSWDRKNELACTHPGRLNSEGLLSPTEDWTLKQPESPNQTAGDTGTNNRPVFPRNVAEELDPTFQAKRRENPAEMATRASAVFPGAVRCQSAPVDGFYDYLDDGSEAAFVLPTKRQTDKSGRQKTRDKKEGCKQQ